MALDPISGLPSVVGLTGAEYTAVVQAGVTKKATTAQVSNVAMANNIPAAIEYVIDGGNGNISARVWGYLTVPFDATITAASLLADQTGSITVNIWKCTYAQFDGGVTHPVAADSITGGAPPAISASTKGTAVLTDWTTTLTRDDVLAFQVPASATNITRVTVTLDLIRVIV